MERRLLAWLPDDGEIMGSNPAPSSIEQNLPQPFLIVYIGLTDRSGGPRGNAPLLGS